MRTSDDARRPQRALEQNGPGTDALASVLPIARAMEHAGSRPTMKATISDTYERSHRRLRAVASRYVGGQDAEDVVHDAFVQALHHSDSFRHEAALRRGFIASWSTGVSVTFGNGSAVGLSTSILNNRSPSGHASGSAKHGHRSRRSPIAVARRQACLRPPRHHGVLASRDFRDAWHSDRYVERPVTRSATSSASPHDGSDRSYG